MLFTTTTQYVVLLLLLFVGWLFGLASHPGGKKWKAKYRDEVDGRTRDRAAAEERDRAQQQRIAELEREVAARETRLTDHRANVVDGPAPAHPAPSRPATVTTSVQTATPAVYATNVGTETPPAAASAARPAFPARASATAGDDFTRLRGVDVSLDGLLKREGVGRYCELASLNDQEEIALERRLDLPAGYLMKEHLREQARLLADGRTDEHAARFG